MRILIFSIISFSFAAQQVFIACEGNFYQSNGSLWTISENQIHEYEENPLGEVVQSLYVDEDKLYVVVNGSGNIQVFDIDDNGLIPSAYIDTEFSGPREIVVVDNYLYFTNWYTADLKKINLDTMEIEAEINMPGLPEDIILHNDLRRDIVRLAIKTCIPIFANLIANWAPSPRSCPTPIMTAFFRCSP